eukprot:584311-Pelagomonas_calceolata.AAC.1
MSTGLGWGICCLGSSKSRTGCRSKVAHGRLSPCPCTCDALQCRLNYFWAMGYNVLMIPLAAGVAYPITQVQLPPWVAGTCMAFSSVSVVLSSLALRRYKRPQLAQLRSQARLLQGPL